MHDLNDLKNRVIAMIVLVLPVSFAEAALDSSNGLQVPELGSGFALAIIALTVFLRLAIQTARARVPAAQSRLAGSGARTGRSPGPARRTCPDRINPG
jgi:uncharacterized membrane protein YqhA